MVKLRKYKAAMQVAIDALSAPEPPSELKEAAEKYVEGIIPLGHGKGDVYGAFIAGAKWQVEQTRDEHFWNGIQYAKAGPGVRP